MELLFLGVSGALLCYLFLTLLDLVWGNITTKDLAKQPPLPLDRFPKVSIIFSALNEEATIRESLLSLLSIDYPHLEIIALNDRSTDRTGEILAALQKEYPDKLLVKEIDSLPSGWFGKNHALYRGAELATGDWLLFTDADVQMHPSTVIKAMSYALEQKCDHLTAYEHHVTKRLGLKLILSGHYHWYALGLRPWRSRYKWSRKSAGRGAFNLVRTAVYRSLGGHKAIAMECLDDLMLGRLIKARGFVQHIVDARSLLQIEWYSSMKGMVQGWEKNGFAFFKFKLSRALPMTALALFFLFWPLVGLFHPSPEVKLLNLSSVALTMLSAAFVCRQFRLSIWYGCLYPVCNSLIIFTICNSILEVYRKKGVVWRDTHYPLEELSL